MPVINQMKNVLHRIRARLYPNVLDTVEGNFIARTDDETSLRVEEICSSMKERAGFTGQYDEAVEVIHQYLNEAMYRVCDGYSINFGGFFSMHPRIGGAWQSPTDPWDPAKHPIRFGFRTLKGLRDIIPHIEVLIEGVHDGSGFIGEFTDVTTESVNETLTPGGIFILDGHKIKVAGPHINCGIYFVDAANPVYREMVSGNLAENTAAKVIGKVPNLAAGQWKVRVVTQYASGGGLTKEPRTIDFGPVLTVS